jgi:hypothetical protein
MLHRVGCVSTDGVRKIRPFCRSYTPNNQRQPSSPTAVAGKAELRKFNLRANYNVVVPWLEIIPDSAVEVVALQLPLLDRDT